MQAAENAVAEMPASSPASGPSSSASGARHSSGSASKRMSSARAVTVCCRVPSAAYSFTKRVVAADGCRNTGTPGSSRAASKSGPALDRIAASQPSRRAVSEP